MNDDAKANQILIENRAKHDTKPIDVHGLQFLGLASHNASVDNRRWVLKGNRPLAFSSQRQRTGSGPRNVYT